MKITPIAFPVVLFLFSGHRAPLPEAEAPLPSHPGAMQEKNVIHLFNGHDFNGWYTWVQDRGKNNDPENVFSIVDGMIRISGEEWGCITTLEPYENYRLLAEFKWGELTFDPRTGRARDSGILLHSQGEDGGSQGIWMHSIECQIIEGGTGDFIVVGDSSGRFMITCEVAEEKQEGSYVFLPGGEPVTIREGRVNWYGRDPRWEDRTGFRGKNDVEHPRGEWNTLECVASKDQLTYYLNGVLVNRAIRVSPSSGRIQVQSEGAEIFFRKVDLVPLEEKGKNGY
jgi:hypothetical protein